MAIQIGDTLVIESVFSPAEKQNMELKRLLARTADRIQRTKGHIEHLERLHVWTVNNLHEMGAE